MSRHDTYVAGKRENFKDSFVVNSNAVLLISCGTSSPKEKSLFQKNKSLAQMNGSKVLSLLY